MLAQIADLDRLLVPIVSPLLNPDGANLWTDQDAMKDFLGRAASNEGMDAWKVETTRTWVHDYRVLVKVYASLRPTAPHANRVKFDELGIIEIADTVYSSCVRAELPPNSFRNIDSKAYDDTMETYTELLITAVEEKLGLLNRHAPDAFQAQILSKLRFLTTQANDVLCHLPIFCLSYSLDVLEDWHKLNHSLREVSIHGFRAPCDSGQSAHDAAIQAARHVIIAMCAQLVTHQDARTRRLPTGCMTCDNVRAACVVS